MKKLYLVLLFVIIQQMLATAQTATHSSVKNAGFHYFKSAFVPEFTEERIKQFHHTNANFKSNAPNLYLPDTIILYSISDTIRYTYTYNTAGYMLSELAMQKINNIWATNYKSNITYDANNKMLTWMYEEWTNKTLEESYRLTFTYDANGNELENVSAILVNSVWINLEKYTYSYDGNGNRLSFINELWDNNAWVYNKRHSYICDAQGNKVSDLYELWANNTWVNNERYSFTYDAGNNMLSDITEVWVDGSWTSERKYDYTYNSKGEKLSELLSIYANSTWSYSNLRTYTYDAGGNLVSQLQEVRSFEGNSRNPINRDNFIYDASNNMLAEIFQDWTDDAWVNSGKKTYTYDANGNMLTGEFFIWNTDTNTWEQTETEPFQISVNGEMKWTNDAGIKIQIHWFSPEATAISHHESNEIMVFPNPAGETLNIRGNVTQSTIRIYSLEGTLIQTAYFSGTTNSIDVSKLEPGIFVLKIETPPGMVIRKFVKN